MNKPDFQTMSFQELRRYVLSHRDDDEAFYTFIDRADIEKTWTIYPALTKIEDLEQYPEFLEKLQKDSGKRIY